MYKYIIFIKYINVIYSPSSINCWHASSCR